MHSNCFIYIAILCMVFKQSSITLFRSIWNKFRNEIETDKKFILDLWSINHYFNFCIYFWRWLVESLILFLCWGSCIYKIKIKNQLCILEITLRGTTHWQPITVWLKLINCFNCFNMKNVKVEWKKMVKMIFFLSELNVLDIHFPVLMNHCYSKFSYLKNTFQKNHSFETWDYEKSVQLRAIHTGSNKARQTAIYLYVLYMLLSLVL